MHTVRLLPAALAAALAYAPFASGQAVTWQVAAGEDGRISVPNLPLGVNRSLTDIRLGDAGAGQIGFRASLPENVAGYWAAKQGVLTRYTQVGVSGAQGPGRAGAESTHVFISVPGGGGESAPDGQRFFLGRAGVAGNTATASYGLWRWDMQQNVEVARSLTDGVLGPGLGAGWVFPNIADFTSSRGIAGGAALLDGNVTSATSVTSHLLAKHVPGQGNKPCMRSGTNEASLAPGLTAGDTFSATWTAAGLSVSATGRVYGTFSASGSRAGIWEICNGAPRAIAADDVAGPLGPAIGVATATFTSDFYTAYPGLGGNAYFFANYRLVDGGSSRLGLFHHNGQANLPLAMNDSAGVYGPHWENATWRVFDTDSLSSAGEYAVFAGGVTTGDGGTPDGIWRVRNGHSPELIALNDLTGAYGPEQNRTWDTFGAIAVLSNGDVVLEAVTDPGDVRALWLLEPGKSPRRVLEIGQSVSVPTSSGTVQSTVTGFDISNGGADFSRGVDAWIGADSSVLVVATVSGYGTTVLTTKVSDRIFSNGFE